MIPKKIHYCWFGDKEKPEEIKKIIKTWKKLNGYEIIEWNEKNFDFSVSDYAKEAYNKKEWAFVSDYVRLKVLYEYGGIYLDTDVEIKKNFDEKFLENKIFLSFMFNCNLSTAIIGSEPNNRIIKQLLDLYDNLELKRSPNNDIFTRFFIRNYSSFKLNNKNQLLDNEIMIYQKEYFENPSINRKKGYSVHHFTASWKDESNKKKKIKQIAKKFLGIYIYQNIIRYKAIYKSPFKEKYYIDKNK